MGGEGRRRVVHDGLLPERHAPLPLPAAPDHGLDGNSGRPRLVRGVTARDRVCGMARLFRPVLGAFSADSLDYDRRGEEYVEEDEALLDADVAPR